MKDRSPLEADLRRYRQNGDFAAQAVTLFILAEIAYEEQEYNIAQGLYAQAWAAYEQVGDTLSVAKAAQRTISAMWHFWREDPNDFSHADDRMNVIRMHELALALNIEAGNIHGQADIYMIMGTSHFYNQDITRQTLNHALACYRVLEDLANQAEIYSHLARVYDFGDDYRFNLEQALKLYEQIGNKEQAAYKYTELADLDQNDNDYIKARKGLETAITLYRETQYDHGIIYATKKLCKFILIVDGYPAYLHYFRETFQKLRQEVTNTRELFSLLWTLPYAASKNRDFDTARYAFQQVIAYAASCEEEENQGHLYWDWGYMEYYEVGSKQMGFALCQRAMMLLQIYSPGTTAHRKQFSKMRHHLYSPAKSPKY
jgi:tetratricopeptide (TPR) repeat protein